MSIVVDKQSLGVAHGITNLGSVSLTTTQAVVAGGTIVLSIMWYGATDTLSSVSGGGLNWQIDKQAQSAGGIALAIVSAYAPSGLASGTVITPTFSATTAATPQSIGGTSFTGIKPTNRVSATVDPGPQNSTTAWSTGNVTVPAGGVLVGTAFGDSCNSSTITSPSIEDWDDAGFGAASGSHTLGHRIETSAGSYSVAGTFDLSGTTRTIGVAYKSDTGVPTLTGTPSQVDASAGDGSTSVTVPADATGAVAFWGDWDANASETLATLTLDGSAFTIDKQLAEGAVTDANGIGVATLYTLTGTGSKTLAWTWSAGGARSEGGQLIIVWIKNGGATRDAQATHSTGIQNNYGPVTVNTEVDDLVFACLVNVSSPYELGGTVVIKDLLLNSESYYVSLFDVAGSTTGVTAISTNYPALVVASIAASAAPLVTNEAKYRHNVTPMGWR